MSYVDHTEDAVNLVSDALIKNYTLTKEDLLFIRDTLLKINNRQSLININNHRRQLNG